MDADELVADRADEKGRDDGAVDAAREGQQHAAAADLAAELLNGVVDEVLGRPGGGGVAGVKQEGAQRLVGAGRVEGGVERQRVGMGDGRGAVGKGVLAVGEDDAAHAGKGGELLTGDVVGMDFAVAAHRADAAGQGGVFVRTLIENDKHVLLHK